MTAIGMARRHLIRRTILAFLAFLARIPILALAVLIAIAPGCSASKGGAPNGSGPLVVPEGCQPLLVDRDDGTHASPSNGACLAPYPSDFHRAPDPTGGRLGDPAVPNLAAFLHARTLGIPQAMPAPESVFGLAPVADADAPSSLTIFDLHVDTTGYAEGKPISPNGVHEGVRVNSAALRHMEAFMKPGGVIVHACDGPRDPE
jgi:hypothetical protein